MSFLASMCPGRPDRRRPPLTVVSQHRYRPFPESRFQAPHKAFVLQFCLIYAGLGPCSPQMPDPLVLRPLHKEGREGGCLCRPVRHQRSYRPYPPDPTVNRVRLIPYLQRLKLSHPPFPQHIRPNRVPYRARRHRPQRVEYVRSRPYCKYDPEVNPVTHHHQPSVPIDPPHIQTRCRSPFVTHCCRGIPHLRRLHAKSIPVHDSVLHLEVQEFVVVCPLPGRTDHSTRRPESPAYPSPPAGFPCPPRLPRRPSSRRTHGVGKRMQDGPSQTPFSVCLSTPCVHTLAHLCLGCASGPRVTHTLTVYIYTHWVFCFCLTRHTMSIHAGRGGRLLVVGDQVLHPLHGSRPLPPRLANGRPVNTKHREKEEHTPPRPRVCSLPPTSPFGPRPSPAHSPPRLTPWSGVACDWQTGVCVSPPLPPVSTTSRAPFGPGSFPALLTLGGGTLCSRRVWGVALVSCSFCPP